MEQGSTVHMGVIWVIDSFIGRLNDTALEAMRELACGGVEDVPSAEQMEILPNIIIHWPQESVFPAIGEDARTSKKAAPESLSANLCKCHCAS